MLSSMIKRNMMGDREAMVNREILSLVKQYCGKKVVTRFLADQKKALSTEQRVLHGAREVGITKDDINTSFDESVTFDHLMTVCKSALSDYEYHEVLLGLGNIFQSHGELKRAEKTFDEVMASCKQAKYSDFIAEALLRRGEIYSRQGRWQESSRDLEESRSLFLKSKDIASLAKLDNILGTSYAEQGLLKEAGAFFSKALRQSEHCSHKLLSGTIFMNQGIVQNILGNWNEALNSYHRALTLFESSGDMTRVAEVHHNMGMSYLSKREFEHANREFNHSLDYSTRLHNPGLVGLAKLGKANVHFHLNDLTLALALCNQALENFKATDDRLSVADAYKVKGMILCEIKEYALAETLFRSSIRMNEEHSNLLNLGETYFELGVMEKKRRRRREAVVAFQHALRYFKRVGARTEVKHAESELENREKGRR